MTDGTHTTSVQQKGSFETRAAEVLKGVRGAFAGILASLPHPVSRAHEISEALGIDKKLGWKISNLVSNPDPFAASQNVPGPAGIKILLKAAKRAQVPESRIASARAAMAEFDRLRKVHAEDRATFEMMLASHAQRGLERVQSVHRRAAFRANSFLFGVQAKAQLRTDICHPASKSGWLDIATLRGLVHLQRIRPNVPWVLARGASTDDEGEARYAYARETLDPRSVSADAVPLMHDFCSQPLPVCRRSLRQQGWFHDEITEGPVGSTGALTCITGEVSRAVVPEYWGEHDRYLQLVTEVYTPCQMLVFDELVHEDVEAPGVREILAYSALSGPPVPPLDESLEVPIYESVTHLGKGCSVLHTPEVPRYPEMVRYACERLGWDSEGFDVYRICMQYPPMPTLVVSRRALPGPLGADET